MPTTGSRRTAVVLSLIMPMANSSNRMPAMVSAGVSPGMATMSRPTEQMADIASSFASDRWPAAAASIIA